MAHTTWSRAASSEDRCARCGLPIDSRHFDESTIVPTPPLGQSIVLARFELPIQYCGVLEYFSQYTNRLAVNPGDIETPGIEWVLLGNGRPLAPYLPVERILNPWGYTGYPLAVRLEENATIELVVRNRNVPPGGGVIASVGGRIAGRYWYDATEGEMVQGRR